MLSCLHCKRSITQGGCVLGFAFTASLSSFAASSGEGSWITSESFLASGDHSNDRTPCLTSVSCCASPPCLFKTQTCVLASLRAERKARYLPSGLKRGPEAELPLAVIGMASQ